jgi:hypothetical protein
MRSAGRVHKTGGEGGVTRERADLIVWQDDLEMCDLAKVQRIAHWKANVISVNGRYTLVHAHLAVGEARRVGDRTKRPNLKSPRGCVHARQVPVGGWCDKRKGRFDEFSRMTWKCVILPEFYGPRTVKRML